MKGTESFPSGFYMVDGNNIEKIESLINSIIAEEREYFCVLVTIKPTNNVKVFLDGDQGITIEKCVQINRKLYKLIEEGGIFSDADFSLEVSSPGIDTPLKMHRQYLKNIGRNVEVVFNDETKTEGKLLQVSENDIMLQSNAGKGKKAITQQIVIPFENIKTTTVQINFKNN